MAYHEDLLKQALELVHQTPLVQANLRRAVSSAYYALFHLLISETVSHWADAGSRAVLTRAFDHTVMRAASNRILDKRNFPFVGEDPVEVSTLRLVAQTFVQLQQAGHYADYDLAEDLEPTQAKSHVRSAEMAFAALAAIKPAPITQHYLASLLVRVR